jgi:hypothetical protein
MYMAMQFRSRPEYCLVAGMGGGMALASVAELKGDTPV